MGGVTKENAMGLFDDIGGVLKGTLGKDHAVAGSGLIAAMLAKTDVGGLAGIVAKLQQADPIIYMYRQRNLTGVSNKVLGVQTYPDGVLRTAFAGLAK